MSRTFRQFGRPRVVSRPSASFIASSSSSSVFSPISAGHNLWKMTMAQLSTASAVKAQSNNTWQGAGAAEFDLRSRKYQLPMLWKMLTLSLSR